MDPMLPMSRRAVAALALAWSVGATLIAPALRAQEAATPQALQARYAALAEPLRHSAFGSPLLLTSEEAPNRVAGEVYAEIAYPIDRVESTFRSVPAICEILSLHLNVHACEPATGAPEGAALLLVLGPKRALTTGATYRMTYEVTTEAITPAYLRVQLRAASGPLSTSDYRILFEAVPIAADRTFVHLSYAYQYGFVAKFAMQAYLATAGRDKIGFTVIGHEPDGRAQYVRGERAALERNVIRYYLALIARCDAVDLPVPERTETALRAWFALTERYAAQLHELDREDYLREKHNDMQRPSAKAK